MTNILLLMVFVGGICLFAGLMAAISEWLKGTEWLMKERKR